MTGYKQPKWVMRWVLSTYTWSLTRTSCNTTGRVADDDGTKRAQYVSRTILANEIIYVLICFCAKSSGQKQRPSTRCMQRWRWRENWPQLHTWYENKANQRARACMCVLWHGVFTWRQIIKKNQQRENQIKSIIKSVLGLIRLMCLQTLLSAIAHLPLYSHTLARPQIASTAFFIHFGMDDGVRRCCRARQTIEESIVFNTLGRWGFCLSSSAAYIARCSCLARSLLGFEFSSFGAYSVSLTLNSSFVSFFLLFLLSQRIPLSFSLSLSHSFTSNYVCLAFALVRSFPCLVTTSSNVQKRC